MPTYANDQVERNVYNAYANDQVEQSVYNAYANDQVEQSVYSVPPPTGALVKEIPLNARLENVLNALDRVHGMLDILQSGANFPGKQAEGRLQMGVFGTAAECDKLSSALEQRVGQLVERLGFL